MGEIGAAAFYFDLGSPECYLAAERVMHALPGPIEWRPVRVAPRAPALDERARALLEQRAGELGLLPLRWPAQHPFDSEPAMIVATYARAIGRGVAYAQAAFRQAFAGGHDLADIEYVLLAAAACEMHPNAVTRALARHAVADELARETDDALRSGVTELPAVRAGGAIFAGADALEEAAAFMGGSARAKPRTRAPSPSHSAALAQ